MKYSLVIPVFNEEQALQSLQQRIDKVMKSIDADFEIIYVDDASTDGSQETLEYLKNQYSQIKIITFAANRGQSIALYAGFISAKGQWIITLDADGQNPPEEILRFLEFEKDFDFITGIRKKRNDNTLRKLSSSIARISRNLILKDTTKDTGCSLRMFKKEIVSSLYFFKNFHRFLIYLVRLHGFTIKEIPIAHDRRVYGKSKYRTINRLMEGIFDLWGVFWFKKRLIDYDKSKL